MIYEVLAINQRQFLVHQTSSLRRYSFFSLPADLRRLESIRIPLDK